jgi:hypothetical protein
MSTLAGAAMSSQRVLGARRTVGRVTPPAVLAPRRGRCAAKMQDEQNRPALRFFYRYLLRLGFLGGIPGYHYCRLLAIYEYRIVLKMKEILRRQMGLPM